MAETLSPQCLSAIQSDGAIDSDELAELVALSNALLQVQDRDRQRIAADLHDSIGQNLSAVKMTIESVLKDLQQREGMERPQRALDAALERLHLSVDELRRIVLDLRPPMLEDLGLLPTLDWCCREFEAINQTIVLRKRIEVEEKEIPDELRGDIYRLVQEALHNVVKHAEAQCVEIFLGHDEDKLVLSVVDDGCGFEPLPGGNGVGLYSMQARCKRWNGSLKIYSAVGIGTRLLFRWPLVSEADGRLTNRLPTVIVDRRVEERRQQH